MLIAHYAHRLPARQALDDIRERARQRGPLWDQVPALVFKAFLLRERGQLGAAAHQYASLYLWQSDSGLRDFLQQARYQVVTDSFGRAAIRARIALDAVRGPGGQARYACLEEAPLPLDADIAACCEEEAARNRQAARQPGQVVSAVGLDTEAWRFLRLRLCEQAPGPQDRSPDQIWHEVLYLAAPLLHTLARSTPDPVSGWTPAAGRPRP
ncbi:MAG: DUF4865 family protein [Curvibacter sp.]|nr:DUF4865 family protein [Curvibacter sp.]